MTSRDRILASINHKEPDRVPIDLGATPSSGISAVAHSNLCRYLKFEDTHTRIYDVVQQLAQPEEEILKLFGVDIVDIGRTFNCDNSNWYDITLPNGRIAQYPQWFHPKQQADGSWIADKSNTPLALMPPNATFFDQVCFPWVAGYPDKLNGLDEAMNKVMWAAFVHSPWDHISDTGFWENLRNNALTLRENTDRAIMIVCGCNLFEWGAFLRRMDNFLMDLVSEPKTVEAFLDALLERHLDILEKVCHSVGDIVDILRFGDDLGMDTGPLMSPEMYNRIFKPRHSIMCKYVHQNSQMKTFLHSCGSIYKLLPYLIEAGYDIINPVQTCCVDMEPQRLKKEFGKDITFWGGGCDTRNVLNRSTPQQVKDHVKKQLEIFAPGGGFVFAAVHNILPDVPPENIIAMLNAIDEFGA